MCIDPINMVVYLRFWSETHCHKRSCLVRASPNKWHLLHHKAEHCLTFLEQDARASVVAYK